MSEEKTQKNRAGDTSITSASLSGKFKELFEEFNMSATECMRRGIAVTLHDLGVDQYQTELNEARSQYVKEFVERLKKDEELKKEYDQIKKFMQIRNNLNKIENLIKEVKNESGDNATYSHR